MISVDANYNGNCLNEDIKEDNFKKYLINLIETNHQINMTCDHFVSSNNVLNVSIYKVAVVQSTVILLHCLLQRLCECIRVM